MKSTHEPFDKELRARLLNYVEEHDKDLWPGIALHIVSEPQWIAWCNRISFLALILLVASTTFLNDEKKIVSLKGKRAEDRSTMPVTPLPHLPPIGNDMASGDQSRGKTSTPERPSSGSEMQLNKTATIESYQERLHLSVFTLMTVKKFAHDLKEEKSSARNRLAPRLPYREVTTTEIEGEKVISDDLLDIKNSSKPERNNERQTPFSVYATAMPTFGYQRIHSNIADGIHIEKIKCLPAFSLDRLGIRIEAGAELFFARRLKVFGGILYYQRQQTIEYTERQADTTIAWLADEVVNMIGQTENVTKSIEYELKNVGFQLGLNYSFGVEPVSVKNVRENGLIGKRKFSHFVGTGLEFHKPLNRLRASDRIQGFSHPSMYVFFNLYYRMQYPQAGRLRAIFQPTLNYSFYISEALNAPFFVKPYGLGLNIGCTYNFR